MKGGGGMHLACMLPPAHLRPPGGWVVLIARANPPAHTINGPVFKLVQVQGWTGSCRSARPPR